jgi:hypothetical protein
LKAGSDYLEDQGLTLAGRSTAAKQTGVKQSPDTRNAFVSDDFTLGGNRDSMKNYARLSDRSFMNPIQKAARAGTKIGDHSKNSRFRGYMDYESMLQFFDRTHSQRKSLTNQNLM